METFEAAEEQSSWETTNAEKGFELQHGCAVLFDLFHNCSCKICKGFKYYFTLILAVKGRLRDYYRYGQVRSCMPYWNDFFLCMRLKLETNEEKARVKNKFNDMIN